MKLHLIIFTLTYYFSSINCYLPVLCVPGFGDITHKLKTVCEEIGSQHVGTPAFYIEPDGSLLSATGLWGQVDLYRIEFDKYFKNYPDGLHVIAHSQGALISRAIIQSTPNHPVKNFISVASPQMGFYRRNIFGLSTNGYDLLSNLSRDALTLLFYNPIGQLSINLAGYWNDPKHQQLFLAMSTFLPYINNLKPHEKAIEYKTNFLRINKLILIGGPDDCVLDPWQSSIGGYFDQNFNVVPLKNQFVFTSDTFGLKTLNDSGQLVTHEVPGVSHDQFVEFTNITTNYFLPYCY